MMLCGSVVGCRKKLEKTTPLPKLAATAPSDTGPGRPFDATPSQPLPPQPPVITEFPPTGLPTTTKNLPEWPADAEQPFRADTVFFDFDKSNIKPSETAKLEAVASKMKSYTGKALRVEGHCDERGTEEYNRALGERRALSAREYLVRLGLDPQMIDTITFGEDRPADPGHNEGAWAKNRRAEFILLTPPR